MRKPFYISFLVLFLCFLFLVSGSAVAYSANAFSITAVNSGVNYLAGMQNTDGGFSSDKGRSSSKLTTAWVIMALKAAGEDVNSGRWVKNGHSPVDYLNLGTASLNATTDIARTLLALQAGEEGNTYNVTKLVERIKSFQQPNGHFAQYDKGEQEMINAHMWSILALVSSDCEIPQKAKALEWLRNCQNADGGFGWAKGLESDPDDTGIAITTLVLLGEKPGSSKTIQKALAYLNSKKDDDGGYTWTGQKSNTAADSWVIQGLIAAGEDSTDTFKHLLSFQNDDGSFNWTRELKSQPVLMTSYAIIALSQKPFPVNIDFALIKANSLKISLTVGNKEAVMNGQKKSLDVPPVIINNRTLVPLRFVGECLGASFRWLPESSSIDITYQGKTFNLLVGQRTEELDTPAIIEDGRTLVPLRYISEKMGATVKWIDKERRIDIER